jgi:chromosome segregation ATPase
MLMVSEAANLKAQVAELYKTQNSHLQKITALEAEVSKLQQSEKQLQHEYFAWGRS